MSKKGAFSSGTGAANRRTKDQAMAAAMKARGVKRDQCRCCICNHLVSLNHLQNHITTHK